MAAEDFAHMLRVKPGCYAFIGNGDGGHRLPGPWARSLHHPQHLVRLQRRDHSRSAPATSCGWRRSGWPNPEQRRVHAVPAVTAAPPLALVLAAAAATPAFAQRVDPDRGALRPRRGAGHVARTFNAELGQILGAA
jgi:hypothetical protein